MRRVALAVPLALLFACGGGTPFMGYEFSPSSREPPSPKRFERGMVAKVHPGDPPFSPIGDPAVRHLEEFDEVVFDADPDSCYALEVRFTDGARLTDEARADSYFQFVLRSVEGPKLYRHFEDDVTSEAICNFVGATKLAVGHPFAAPHPKIGYGTVTIQVKGREMNARERAHRDASGTKFMAGGAVVVHDPDGRFRPTGVVFRRELDDFTPEPLALSPRHCTAVEIRAIGPLTLEPEATMADHFFMVVQRGGGADPACESRRTEVRARELCNRLATPMRVTFELWSHTGKPPGKGTVEVMVRERPMIEADERAR